MRRAAALALVVIGLPGCGGGGGSGKATATPAKHNGAAARSSAEPAVGSGRPTVVATGIPLPTNLAFDDRGRLWVSSGAGGKNPSDGIWYVGPDGQPRHVARGLTAAFGLVWAGGRLYVAHIASPSSGRVTVLRGFDGTAFARRHTALDGVPVGNNTMGSIVLGLGWRLFVGAGTTGAKGGPTGRVLSFAPGEHRAVVEATGLNSAFGLAFYGRRLLVTDNGRDDLGPYRPPDEVDAFDPSGSVVDFGYPECYGQGGRRCAGTRPPLVAMPPHASPVGIAVRGDVAHVAENGSLFAKNPTRSDIQRVDLRTGTHAVFWRSRVKHDPTGLAIGPDGDLYLALYASGKIVRFPL